MSLSALEDIGFYTLSDARAANAGPTSPLWRCELIVTDLCNLRCPYCRGLRSDCRGDMPVDKACHVLDLWIDEGLRNVRFSGGEPTLHGGLGRMVEHCRTHGVERIAISTNGTSDLDLYTELIDRGANDVSISLDGGCCSVGDKMVGGVRGAWDRTINTIRELSKRTYVTVGIVLTEDNLPSCRETIWLASELGVSDIRVIPAAQHSRTLVDVLGTLPTTLLAMHPILRYRVRNAIAGRGVRGLCNTDCRRCHLAADDMVVAGKWHFPCIIHLREGGDPVGEVGPNMREERMRWIESHDSYGDPICRYNCLDVCVDYNNKAATQPPPDGG